MGAAVGVDLGTTNTVVSAVRDGRPETLQDSEGRRLLPSVVSFHPSGRVIVGQPARDRSIVDPTSTIFSVKRLIGRPWDSPAVERARSTMPFEMVKGEGEEVLVTARGQRYTLPEISAFVLRRAKAIAESALGEPVTQAVITVPANFNDPQREATKLAAKLAGLDVLRILNEPTAAALAYGAATTHKERVVVYDLGGGTFDVTLLDVSGAVFQVLATGGDTALGGDDVDELIANLMREHLLKNHRYDVQTDPTARSILKARAERLKMDLSAFSSGEAALSDFVRGDEGRFVDVRFPLERAELTALVAPILERTLETCRRTISKAGFKPASVDRVLLVGGATRMPIVKRRVSEFFEREPAAHVNPDEVVAHGAAIQAAALTRSSSAQSSPPRARPSFSFAIGPPKAATAMPAARDSGVPEAPSASAGRPTSVRPSRTVPPLPRDEPASHPSSPPVDRIQLPPRPSLPPAAETRASSSRPPSSPEGLHANPARDDLAPRRSHSPSADVGVPAPSRPPTSYSSVAPGPMSAEQEELIKAFLGVEAARPSSPPKEKSAVVEAELLAFLRASDATRAAAGIAPVSEPPVRPPEAAPRSLRSPPEPVISDVPPDLDVPGRGPRVASPPAALSPATTPLPMTAGPPLLIDVTPISLGVETVGGFFDTIIGGNSPVPCERTRVFRTASDGQTSVIVRIGQGESSRFDENTNLGNLLLSGFRAAPRGEVQIEVTFEIDADGILNVKAAEAGGSRIAKARIELLGAQNDAAKVSRMMERQASLEVV